jgi:integrase
VGVLRPPGLIKLIPLRPLTCAAAGIEPERRIYDLRHTYATFSLAAGVSLFTLARRMGTSVEMIDRTYGHLAPDAEEYERGLLDAFDSAATGSRAAIQV